MDVALASYLNPASLGVEHLKKYKAKPHHGTLKANIKWLLTPEHANEWQDIVKLPKEPAFRAYIDTASRSDLDLINEYLTRVRHSSPLLRRVNVVERHFMYVYKST